MKGGNWHSWVLAGSLFAMLLPTRVYGHEVLHAIEHGKALAVKAYFADGEVLAYTEYQVYSPTDPKIPHQKGRTDRNGYLSFVPTVPGKWQVKLMDASGHGLDLDVETGASLDAKANERPPQGGSLASWAFALRPFLGVFLIAVLFSVLVLYYRKKGARK